MLGMCLISSGLLDDDASRAPAPAHRFHAAGADDAAPGRRASWLRGVSGGGRGGSSRGPGGRSGRLQPPAVGSGERGRSRVRRGLPATDDPARGLRRRQRCERAPGGEDRALHRLVAREGRLVPRNSKRRSWPSSNRAASDPALVAFKSVIAYRTGLDVDDPPTDYCERVFRLWREDDYTETRAHAKPVRDRLLRRTLEVAKRNDRPVHIHCGGGDPEIVLAHARPQDLFPLLVEYDSQPVVLIHSGWPWLEEGAFIASVLPMVYLELSLTLPWASLAVDQKLEVLLGIAPPAKLLYGSDEASEPEVIWLTAQIGREALGRVLGTGCRARLAHRARGRRDRRGRPRRERAPPARHRSLTRAPASRPVSRSRRPADDARGQAGCRRR